MTLYPLMAGSSLPSLTIREGNQLDIAGLGRQQPGPAPVAMRDPLLGPLIAGRPDPGELRLDQVLHGEAEPTRGRHPSPRPAGARQRSLTGQTHQQPSACTPPGAPLVSKHRGSRRWPHQWWTRLPHLQTPPTGGTLTAKASRFAPDVTCRNLSLPLVACSAQHVQGWPSRDQHFHPKPTWVRGFAQPSHG